MSSIKFHFRPSGQGEVQEGKLFIRIIHRRRIKTLSTPYRLFPEEWNDKEQCVNFAIPTPDRVYALLELSKRIEKDQSRYATLLSGLSSGREYSIEELLQLLSPPKPSDGLGSYCCHLSDRLEAQDQHRTARAYRSAVCSLEKFACRSVHLSEITAPFMISYENYLREKGLQMNTISFYMRNLRAIYYRAVKDKKISPQEENPFEQVYTGIYETRRRALSQQDLNRLARLEEQLDPLRDNKLRQALYIFLFCFHARGMSFVDMAHLRKSDLNGQSILYKRRKTGRWLEVKITRQMKQILRYFHNKDSELLFPVLDLRKADLRVQYQSKLSQQNKLLRVLQQRAGIQGRLTTHCSRHTWATLAKRAGILTEVISEGLGHSDIRTTYKYLASFDRATLDTVSDKVSAIVKIPRKTA